jgi:hypothetical protein
MPKFIPNYNDWAFSKHCWYCGKLFYPIKENQDFCDYKCKHYWNDYIETIEAMYIDDLYKQEEEYGF